MPVEMKRLLVTGAAGFLGSSLCRALVAEGHRVVGIDNLSSGSLANLKPIADEPRFRFIEADITEPLSIAEPVDGVFHLACPASPLFYDARPLETALTASFGTKNVLDVARANGATIVTTSTSEVYGQPVEHPQPEHYTGNVHPMGPRAPYVEGKRFAETLFAIYRRQFGIDTKVVRVFNTYGPCMRLDDGRVISAFLSSISDQQPITIHGDGSQTRSFCYVDDLIEGLLRLSETGRDVSGPVNLGGTDEITVKDLARLVNGIAAVPSPVAFVPARPDDPVRRQPDVSLAQSLIGWQPTTPLIEGLTRTLEHHGIPTIPVARDGSNLPKGIDGIVCRATLSERRSPVIVDRANSGLYN